MEQEDGADPITRSRKGVQDIGDKVIDVWKNPRHSFLIGILVGIVLIGMIVVAPPQTFQQQTTEDVGEKVVNHFQDRAPTGLEYELVDVEHHESGIYRVDVRVTRGSITSEETVYTTSDGKWAFTQEPEHVQPQLSK